ncbi:hypothetical protein M501DRAFT_933333 [Patellaria atrata CBS 101060]|uniref:Nucleoporin NSP1 n=1 Tax=Patellaria atrata CBS 101060 TaxID=1346257 RepID=A0A9P4SAY7_9PEZI|nr:hypothetical protein M501DRAFT_933333 [Patellaria atrata CBS 101060]
MDEIITRWASDLSKYQKDFQKQAEQVAAWDRLLVENSDKITTLFNKTFQAERDAAEVERQLSNVEMQQHELDTWLTRYEGEVDALLEKQMGGERQGPDSEREKTYKLAEKLSSRLNELNQSLGEMVEETNSISASVSRSNKSDDPLSQVIRVLNSHLAQLQVIDSGAAELKGKIAAAQREGAGIARHNGWNGVGSDPADDFYRSFRGGR